MNEVTRIHIAKVAYDIEVSAKKQLQKYLNSLESYTQDADVLEDIEIRITELLAEQGVAAGGVIGVKDVAEVRKKLGEPYEFADTDGDVAVGATVEGNGRRFYRSTDNAILGGVLSGIAAYFNVNPLWTRLIFLLVLFISFGLAFFAYIFFWIFTPAAKTATEKLQLAGKDVTVDSIRALNAAEETTPKNTVAPVVQNILAVGLGLFSLLGAIVVFAITVAGIVSIFITDNFTDFARNSVGIGDGYAWLAWLVIWIMVAGGLLLASLFGLIAYAFFAKKLTKRMVVSGIVIIVLGVLSVISAVGITGTQSWRISNEVQSMVQETKSNLPKEFASVKSVSFDVTTKNTDKDEDAFYTPYATIRYVVDDGPARYELSSLPTAKPIIKVEGTNATISVSVVDDFRNSFAQPTLTVYGPALDSITTLGGGISYAGVDQETLQIVSEDGMSTQVSGNYNSVTVSGSGSVDLSGGAIQKADIQSSEGLNVALATVRELIVTQPDTCSASASPATTQVTVRGITTGSMTYNGQSLPAKTHTTSCASVIVSDDDDVMMY